MLDREIAKYIKQKLNEAAQRAAAESPRIAPSYACWRDFNCLVEVYKPSEFKWFSLKKAEA